MTSSFTFIFKMADRGMVGILDVDLGESSIPRMMNVEGKDVSQQCFFGWVPVYTHKDQVTFCRANGSLLNSRDDAVV
ncbi:cytosolic Fe-S cluster assembly factor NUBP2 homolog [Oculina patagonica]